MILVNQAVDNMKTQQLFVNLAWSTVDLYSTIMTGWVRGDGDDPDETALKTADKKGQMADRNVARTYILFVNSVA